MLTMIASMVASLISGRSPDALGRRKAPIMVACVVFAVGLAMPWIFPTAMGMYLFGGISSFGYGMYLSVDQALNVDVLPNKETAGKDPGFMNIATCAGRPLAWQLPPASSRFWLLQLRVPDRHRDGHHRRRCRSRHQAREVINEWSIPRNVAISKI